MILLNENTKCLVQGITGKQGSFHTEQMLNYNTNIVAGITPGKGGQKFLDKVRDVVPPCNEMSWEELKSDYADKVECNKKEIVRIKDVYLGRLDKPMMNKIYELLTNKYILVIIILMKT